MLVLQESRSTYRSVKPKQNQSSCISQHFSILFLLSEGHFLGFVPKHSLLKSNSGDFRKVAVLENDGAGD